MLLEQCCLPDDLPAAAEPPQSARLICLCIAACVAIDFGLDASQLFATKTRSTRLSHARQVAMYLAHVEFALPFETVGRQFGRDRSTVSHACRTIEDGRDDRWLDRRVAALAQICRGAVAVAEERP